MVNMSSMKTASLSMCFSVGAVLFSSHAGGGFATGNQENVYFVSLGWLGPITAIITMLLFTLTIKEAMNMYNSRHLTSYRQLFQNLYRPFTGLNYYAGIGVVGIIIFFLTIFGAGLVRRATTYMGMAILAMVVAIFSVGIYSAGSVEGTQAFTAVMAQDFAVNGFSNVPTAILHAFTYAGFQCVVIPTMIVVGTPLVTRKNCATSMWFSFAMNAAALTLAVVMLLGWSGYYGKSPLPTLTSCQAMGSPWLTIVYSAFLMLCLISTGVTTVFGFTARFSEINILKKISSRSVIRAAIVTAFIIIASMTVSIAGLTNIIKYGYGYCGYAAIAIIIVPFLTIGRYKNKRYANDMEYRARIDSMNENPQAAQAFKPTAEAAGH